MNQLKEQIKRRYALEEEVFRLGELLEETGQKLRQAKHDSREAEAALLEYTGSLRSFLDGIRGKKETRLETLRQNTSRAKAALEALAREQEQLLHRQNLLREEETALPSGQELKEAALEQPETASLWAREEIRLCAGLLLPLLEGNLEALEEYRQQLRGNRAGEILSQEQLHEIGTAHIRWASRSAQLLTRLKDAMAVLEMPFVLDGYFLNPAGYIVSAAARHNQISRVNDALTQVESLKKQLARLSELL